MSIRKTFGVAASLALALFAASAHAQEGPTTRPLPALGNASVSVPWNELARLIDLSRGAGPEKAPVDFLFAPAAVKAAIGATSAKVSIDIDITLLSDGYVLVPLGPADLGITAVMAGNEAAPIVLRDKTLLTLLSGKGKKKLTVTAERPIKSDGGVSQLSLPLPPAPLVNLTATFPILDLDVKAADATAVTVAEANNQTTLTATYPGSATASLSWKQRPKEAAQDARVYAETESLVTIERGLARTKSRVAVSIERAAVKQVKLSVDPSAAIISVTGKGVSGWSEAAGKDAAGKPTKTVTVEYGEPVDGERSIEIVGEGDLAEQGGAAAIGPPTVQGARRDRGVIAVETRGGYDVRPGESTMERASVSELPASLRDQARGTLQLAYRYAGTPASATLTLERIKPQPAKLFALTQTRAAVDRGVLRCRAEVTYEILHAGIDSLRISLPPGVDFVSANGPALRGTQLIDENNTKMLVVSLKDVAKGSYALTIDYDYHFQERAAGAPATKPATQPAGLPATRPAVAATAGVIIPVISHPDAAQDRGYIGIESRGGYEVTPSADAAERIDVKELPQVLWSLARSPLVAGYRYENGQRPLVSLSLARHQDLDVLIAMSDVCEASTTFTTDGKSVTKMMFVVRNNLKPSMTLTLPEGAQVWSTFVDDRPVTPSITADGRVLIPLKKSDDVGDEDEESYRAKREKRRKTPDDEPHKLRDIQKAQQQRESDDLARDLKPYDVEIVFVTPSAKFLNRGQIATALPKSDVPIGHLAWAIFLPKSLRVVNSDGNLNEVSQFTLPFRHFGEAEWARQMKMAEAKQQLAQAAQEQLAKAQDAAKKLAEASIVQGVLPVRVEIPIVGEIHRFEKFLTVDEMPSLTLTYSRKAE